VAKETNDISSLLAPKKLLTHLLGWCISIAIKGGDWDRIFSANPLLVLGLCGCTIVSLFVNGVMFWLVIRPVHRVGLGEMQWLNMVTAILNYAPIRAGLIARVAYNLRVNGMSILQIGAWLAALGYTMLLALGACILATIIWPSFDWIWAAIVLGQLVLGGLLTSAIMKQGVVVRYGKGMDQMLGRPECLWGALVLRMFDQAAFVGRMACAAAIIGLEFDAPKIMLLGFASLAVSLNPLGRLGFREAAVIFIATRLATETGEQLMGQMASLALIDSAGEAMIAIPAGAICLIWYRKRWRRATEQRRTADESTQDGAESAT